MNTDFGALKRFLGLSFRVIAVCAGLLACRYCIVWIASGAPTDSLIELKIATGCAIFAATTACVGTYLLKSRLKATAVGTNSTPAASDSDQRTNELNLG